MGGGCGEDILNNPLRAENHPASCQKVPWLGDVFLHPAGGNHTKGQSQLLLRII